jgi:putative sigma-54 modulation protein
MNINIKATNVDLTEDLRIYIEDKMSCLNKYFDNIIEVRVEVGKESDHHQKGDIFFAEVNVKVPNDLIRVKKTEESQFKAVDKTKDHLREMLGRYKGKLRGKKGGKKLDIFDIRKMEEE